MSNYRLSETHHLAIGRSPIADVFSGTVYSDIVNMQNYGRCRFIVVSGVGATGTSLITVEACDDTVPTNVSAIVFTYREYGVNTDVPGTLTRAATTGFTTAAGSGRLIDIEVHAEDLIASGYKYVRLKTVEQTDSPVLGAILIELSDPKSSANVDATART